MWQETTPNVLYLVIICLISLRFSPFPAHPNIKLFITQCALQSVQQTVYLVCLYWDIPPLLIRITVRRKLPL